mgnify:CR=1 FL=1
MELFILLGGFYALYITGKAIATTLDYNSIQKGKN